jgi:rhodanese-related sulfurtransferase
LRYNFYTRNARKAVSLHYVSILVYNFGDKLQQTPLNKGGGFMNQATTQQMPEISATDLKQRLDKGDDVQIVDVREADEVAIGTIPNSIHIPLAQVINRMSEIDPARETVVHCKMGGRSARAIQALKQSGFTGNLLNLKGGITAWSNEVDPSVPKY